MAAAAAAMLLQHPASRAQRARARPRALLACQSQAQAPRRLTPPRALQRQDPQQALRGWARRRPARAAAAGRAAPSTRARRCRQRLGLWAGRAPAASAGRSSAAALATAAAAEEQRCHGQGLRADARACRQAPPAAGCAAFRHATHRPPARRKRPTAVKRRVLASRAGRPPHWPGPATRRRRRAGARPPSRARPHCLGRALAAQRLPPGPCSRPASPPHRRCQQRCRPGRRPVPPGSARAQQRRPRERPRPP